MKFRHRIRLLILWLSWSLFGLGLYGIGFGTWLASTRGFGSDLVPFQLTVLGYVAALLLAIAGRRCLIRARSLKTLGLVRIFRDHRPPVLYLRSFQDDGLSYRVFHRVYLRRSDLLQPFDPPMQSIHTPGAMNDHWDGSGSRKCARS